MQDTRRDDGSDCSGPAQCEPSLPPLFALRTHVRGRARGSRHPLDVERPEVPEQRSPHTVRDRNLDAVAAERVVEPLAHVGDAGEELREPETDPTFVETLR